MLPDDGRSISRNIAHLNILVHDMINLLYYEYWTDKQKYLYVNIIKLKYFPPLFRHTNKFSNKSIAELEQGVKYIKS